ncbi:MAG: zf-HC2 domain-containing protein [Candidatus Aminicenantes bacterium]|nr:zf-HC2 domain-containing protein [Candidatus Aminicenantes bacterium]
MNCRGFQKRLFVYQDGRLAGPDRAEFERHGRECPACAALMRDAEEIGERLRGDTAPIPAPDWDKAWRRIRAAATPRRLRPLYGLPRWALAGAAFLAVFVLGVAFARLVFLPPEAGGPRSAGPAFAYTPQDFFSVLQPVIASDPAAGLVAEPAVARRLLDNLYLLKARAEKTNDEALRQLLADIELVLLEIAHMDRSDPEQARLLGLLIREKGLPLKMKVFKFSERKSTRI